MTLAASLEADDAAWLKEQGTLIFLDTFEREEDGNLAKAINNDWNSATAERVPNIKMLDLDAGRFVAYFNLSRRKSAFTR